MASKGADAPTTEKATDDARKRDPILSLTTLTQELDTIEVDGEAYDVYGFKHLSDEGEAEVMALLARYENLSMRLVTTQDDREAIGIARKLRAKRIDLLAKLTSIPKDVASSLSPPDQVKLVRAVQSVAGLVSDDGDGDAS